MILDILTPVARLLVATLAGYALFKIPWMSRHLTRGFVFAIVNIVFPLYFVHSLPSQWASGIAAGWQWMVIFFLLYIAFFAVQYGLARLLVNRVRLLRSEHPDELTVLFVMHNAGYIPIPIIAALAPPAVLVYMSFYTMAFVLGFFTIAVWIIQAAAATRAATHAGESSAPRHSARFKLNAPVVGILLGVILAATGIYARLPDWATLPFRAASFVALDAIMVALGAIIASIPKERLSFRPEFGGLVLYKMILFPLAVVGIVALIPLRGLAADVAAGIRMALIVQAAVPPATNIVVITKAFGTEEQTDYAGGAIVTTYLASIVLLPGFLILSRLLFG